LLFVMAGGGTGGHVVPALAVAEELRRRGHTALFAGTRRGMEARLVPAAGHPIEWIEISGLQRVGWRQRWRTLAALPKSVLQARALLRRHGAAAVFSMGGYVAGPVMLAAWLHGTPMVLMEPNAMPGLVSRWMARVVRRALLNFEETRRYFPADRAELCGLPVRPAFFSLTPRAQDGVLRVLVTGGSRGSRTLNRAVLECLPLPPAVQLTLQTGADEYAAVEAAAAGRCTVTPFIEDMPAAYAAADFVVSRSGAGAVAELAAAGKPSLLVPFPYAADDHQYHNAAAFERAGAALLLRDMEMNGAALRAVLVRLATAPEELHRMGAAARRLARPGAAARAAELLEQIGGGIVKVKQ
jgi:UDP-N-acetylglucosamine--N-acetylmuramyl-(pentapeptide) pyrophosphoryl-undecaprenol N-acetylglucosamine transferase